VCYISIVECKHFQNFLLNFKNMSIFTPVLSDLQLPAPVCEGTILLQYNMPLTIYRSTWCDIKVPPPQMYLHFWSVCLFILVLHITEVSFTAFHAQQP
jgi:hypothetical protein